MNRLGPLAQQFLSAVHAYRLADRYPEIRQYLYLAQSGRLSEGTARALLIAIEPLILELERCPSTLPLAADQDELGDFDERPENVLQATDRWLQGAANHRNNGGIATERDGQDFKNRTQGEH